MSYWSTSDEHAAHYAFWHDVRSAAALYRLDVAPALVLDMRGPDGWDVLMSATGIDESDYDVGVLGHDLLQDLAPVLASHGFDWVAHSSFGTERREVARPGAPPRPDEWLYLGESILQPTLDRLLPDDSTSAV